MRVFVVMWISVGFSLECLLKLIREILSQKYGPQKGYEHEKVPSFYVKWTLYAKHHYGNDER